MNLSELQNIDALKVACFGLATYSGILKLLVIYFYRRSEKLTDNRINELMEEMKQRDARLIALENENSLLKQLNKKHHEA